ncbi:thymidine kinase [Spiroplasma floricola]|uniref:Thymidine kinase n=1 Tax=Spiroplasma floricola 23-6 TaxID=1336749 RepID=A0A2K8SFD5_9MOLU|nr:thymidine kinase [Spiroplasma floricola]AUB32141.1 thymidine kinase [Spiroplasma floricola 23-6]
MTYRMNFNSKKGWIELITGCMFAGKTEEFIKRLKRYKYAQQNVLVFKPLIDDRYSKKDTFSHSGMSIESIPVKDSEELLDIFYKENEKEKVDIIGIDEIQFLDTNIVEIIKKLADEGVIVVANGLDKDFKNDPFQNVDKLLVEAEYVDKLTSICHSCGGNANRTQRIINGEPAKANEPIIVISANEKYEARCRHCYIKPQ